MPKIVCIKWFSDPPRTGGEMVFNIVCEALSTVLDVSVETYCDELRQDSTNINKPITTLINATSNVVRRNQIIRQYLKRGFDVYSNTLYGTLIYVQPRARLDITSAKIYIKYKDLIDKMTRLWRENIRLGVYNSNYTMKRFKIGKSVNNFVVYPPLIRDYGDSRFERRNMVLVLSRIGRTKNLELAGHLSEQIGNKVVLAGYLEKYDQSYYDYIKSRFRKLTILPNIDEDEKRRFLNEAEIVLATSNEEPFGMTKLEAMSAGAVPLVPNSGGWPEGVPEEFVFKDLEELKEKIKQYSSYSDENLSRELKNLSKSFRLELFKERIASLADKYM